MVKGARRPPSGSSVLFRRESDDHRGPYNIVHRVSSRSFNTATALGFVIAALVLYGRALNAGFVADDWPFLALCDAAQSPAVLFEPLVGRYLRPFVVLIYCGNFQVFGLWPLPYHVSVVLLHALDTWLLCLLATKLSGRRSIGVLTGLLFVAFAGHSEAVTWIGGVADVVLAPFILGALVLIAHGLEAERPARWLVPAAMLMPLGLLAKETAVVGPVLGAALCAFVASRSPSPRRAIARGAAVLAAPATAVAAYLLVRTTLFGSPVAAYAELGTSTGMFFRQLRAFILRVFLPAYSKLALAWAANTDLLIIAAGAAVCVFAAVFARQRQHRALVVFTVAAIAISLGPALPLTISLSTTETERVVYIPTAFGALLTVLVVDALVKSVVLQRALLIGLIAAHAFMLQRFNRNWIEAGHAFGTIIRTFVETARAHDPGPGGRFFILNLPDNVRGAYVFRRGFYEGLHFAAPDLERRQKQIVSISSHTLWRAAEPVYLAQTGALDFIIDVAPNRFLQTSPPTRTFFQFLNWHPQGYHLRFADMVGKGVVLHTSEGRVRFVTDVRGKGSPFGFIDTPADGASCDTMLTFAGWALDDEAVAEVAIELSGEDGVRVPLGAAAWAYNTRPDVALLFEGTPHLDRSGWSFALPCRRIAGGSARIHAVAIDARGNRTELGTRIVRTGPRAPVMPRQP